MTNANHLLLDAGNSRLKFRLESAQGESLEQGALTYQDLSQLEGLEFMQLSLAAVRLPEPLQQWLELHPESQQYLAKTGRHYKTLTNSYEQIETMGVDRWLGMVAAIESYPGQKLAVISLGTAITVDLIADSGEHIGGYIVPGLQLAQDTLFSQTERVKPVGQVDQGSLAPGKSTRACVEHGVLFQAVALLKAVMEQYSPEKILLAGGDSADIIELIRGFSAQTQVLLEPDLVLNGLKYWQARDV